MFYYGVLYDKNDKIVKGHDLGTGIDRGYGLGQFIKYTTKILKIRQNCDEHFKIYISKYYILDHNNCTIDNLHCVIQWDTWSNDVTVIRF